MTSFLNSVTRCEVDFAYVSNDNATEGNGKKSYQSLRFLPGQPVTMKCVN